MTIIKNQISEDDLQKIGQLRSLVLSDLTPYYNTDFNLLRWLQGHANLSIEEIAKKMRYHLKLRKSTWKLDEMHKRERNHPIHWHWRRGITGRAGVMENCIVNVEQCGRTDYSGMMESFSLSEVMKARVPDLEEMLHLVMQMERETGKQAYILYIMDISHLEYNRKLYDLVTGSMRSLAEFMADHYVEMVKFFMPVCLPSFATVLYTVVKPLLPERTRDKVRILSASSWKDEMLEFADKEVLPSLWNDETHEFPAHLDLPAAYPIDKYYNNRGMKPPANVVTVLVNAGKCKVQTFRLETGDKVSWWVSGNRNMGFGFFFTENENEPDDHCESLDQVTPAFSCMPGPIIVPLEDTVTIEKPGFYKLWYSNARSWWSTLSVQQAISIERSKVKN